MTIDPVELTPGAWVTDFNDNFEALKGISLSPSDPLYSQYQHITNVAGNLHWQLGQWAAIGQTDPNRAYAGMQAMSPQIYAWLNQVNDFANSMQNKTTNTDSLTAIKTTANNWVEKFDTFIHTPLTDLLGLSNPFQHISDNLNAAVNNAVNNAVPVLGWIALGVLAIFLIPELLNSLED